MQLMTRLWQRASAVTWYQRHMVAVPADVVAFTTPAPVEIVTDEVVLPEPPAPPDEEPKQ